MLLLLLHTGHYEVIISGNKFIMCDCQHVQLDICHALVQQQCKYT